MNFVILISAFKAIADQSYKNKGLEIYQKLPYNKYGAFNDLTLWKANVIKNGRSYILDIAFRQNEIELKENNQFYYQAEIIDIGDLSTSYSYEEIDASEFELNLEKYTPKLLKMLQL
ncbi:MAG: hypothetical protein R2825_25030 [Saprospiraceae bacterium]